MKLSVTLTLTFAVVGVFFLQAQLSSQQSENKNLRAPAAVVATSDASSDTSSDVSSETVGANCKETQTEPSGTGHEVTQVLPQKLAPLIDPTLQMNMVSQFFPMMMAFMNMFMQSMMMSQFVQPQLQMQTQPQMSPLLNPMLNLSVGQPLQISQPNPVMGQWQTNDRVYSPSGFFAF